MNNYLHSIFPISSANYKLYYLDLFFPPCLYSWAGHKRPRSSWQRWIIII